MTSTPHFFRALADRTRLRVVNLLARGPLCVCDIQYILGQPQSSVSRHLAHLRASGLVRDHRDGMRIFYELTGWDSGLRCGVLETLRRHLRADPEYRRDLNVLGALKAAGACHREGFSGNAGAGARRRTIRARSTRCAGRMVSAKSRARAVRAARVQL